MEKEELPCGACQHPAKGHGSQEDIEALGIRAGCEVGVYVGLGFGCRLVQCGCDVPRSELQGRLELT